MMRFFLFLFLYLISQKIAYSGVFESLYHGEKNPADYHGPNRPIFHLNSYQGTIEHDEQKESDRPYDNRISSELIDLKQYLENDFLQSSLCPNSTLAENSEYMRYLYRLITLSFLYESLIHYQETSINLGLKDHSCNISWKEFLHQCRPKTEEMKKFIRRAGKVVETYRYTLPQDHSFKRFFQNWQELLKKKIADMPISMKRLKIYCDKNKMNCKLNQLDSITTSLHGICSEDWTTFKKICSEEDLLLGMSNFDLPKELILNSNVVNVLNKEGNARECLERFTRLAARKESRNSILPQMIPSLLNFNQKNLHPRFLYGRLFIPGALKEFDDKGLDEFLFAETTPTPTPTPLATPILVVKKIKTPTPTPVPKPKIIKTLAPTPEPTVATIKLSSFLLACDKLDRERLKSIDLDMELFKKDHTLSEEFKTKMNEKLKPFQTRQALSDMKEFDRLGTKEVPVKLLFLKYLIDTNQHQGLFNIIAVLGNKFYVHNDLDIPPKKGSYPPRFISLKNDESTGNKWLISILDELRISDTKKL
jgi:hypothetical protein